MNPFEFLDEHFIAKARDLGYQSLKIVILACVVLTHSVPACDGRTDRQTDNPTVANNMWRFKVWYLSLIVIGYSVTDTFVYNENLMNVNRDAQLLQRNRALLCLHAGNNNIHMFNWQR